MVWIRRWLLLATVVPVAAWVLDKVRESMEQRRGRNRITGTLEQASRGLRRMGGRRRR